MYFTGFFAELPLSLTPRGRKRKSELAVPCMTMKFGQHVKGITQAVMHPCKHPRMQQGSNAAVILAALVRGQEDSACSY